MDKLSGVDVNCACATNDEFWAIMMFRFGSIFANDIVSICTVVPVTCGPWRAEIAKELLGLLTPSQSEGIDTALSACLKCALVDPRANYESVFSRVLDAGRTGISPFAGCLAPPTAVCYSCQGALQKNNRPVMVTYFTVSVPSQSRRSSFDVEIATSIMASPSLATRRKGMSTIRLLGQQKHQMLHMLTDWL